MEVRLILLRRFPEATVNSACDLRRPPSRRARHRQSAAAIGAAIPFTAIVKRMLDLQRGSSGDVAGAGQYNGMDGRVKLPRKRANRGSGRVHARETLLPAQI